MNIAHIITAIQANRINITQHAWKEAREDNLILDEIFLATLTGEIIENYPADKPYPSCLTCGYTKANKPVHTVWAYDDKTQIGILITVYQPDPERWIDWKIRK